MLTSEGPSSKAYKLTEVHPISICCFVEKELIAVGEHTESSGSFLGTKKGPQEQRGGK